VVFIVKAAVAVAVMVRRLRVAWRTVVRKRIVLWVRMF
jgi:hypothetical protein